MRIAHTGPKLCEQGVVVHRQRGVPLGVGCRNFVRHEPRCGAPVDRVPVGQDMAHKIGALVVSQRRDVLFLASIRCDMDTLDEDLLERVEDGGEFILIMQLGK